MKCSHIATCPMFPLFKMESSLNVWKVNFCEANFTRCARYQKSSCGDDVPKNLLPNGHLLGVSLK